MAFERMRIFTGNANPKLAEAVVRHMNISLGRCIVGRFSDGEVMVERIKELGVAKPRIGLVEIDLGDGAPVENWGADAVVDSARAIGEWLAA